MSRLVSFILSVFILSSSFGDIGDDKIDPKNFDQTLYEKVLLLKINDYRKEKGIRPLMSNSIIYKVAADQNTFLKTEKEITHDQPTAGKKNVRERLVSYINVKSYSVAENIARTYVLISTQNYLRSGSTQKSIATTYDEAAIYMLNAWIASEFHNKNLLNPDYQLSGIASYFNPQNYSLTAVQVFATIK